MEMLCLPGTLDRVLLLWETRLHQRPKAQDVQTCQMYWCLPVTDSAGHRTPQRDARSKATEKEIPPDRQPGCPHEALRIQKGGRWHLAAPLSTSSSAAGNP